MNKKLSVKGQNKLSSDANGAIIDDSVELQRFADRTSPSERNLLTQRTLRDLSIARGQDNLVEEILKDAEAFSEK